MRSAQSGVEVLAEIKGHSHWRFEFTPATYERERVKRLAELEGIVRECKVSLRGWDFPPLPARGEEQSRGENYVQGWVSWSRHRDFWRFYQSGQLIYLFSLWEDDPEYEGVLRQYMVHELEDAQVPGFVDVTHLCWLQLEAFIFISRLASRAIYAEGANAKISLIGAQGRVLSFGNFRRSLSQAYRAGENELSYRVSLGPADAISGYRESACTAARHLLERFGLDLADETVDSIMSELLPPDRSA